MFMKMKNIYKPPPPLFFMVYSPNYPSYDGESKELAYDLRQGLAKVLISSLENIKMFREERDYKNWFEELDGLFIDISMKLKTKEKDKYNIFMKELNVLIRKEPQIYLDPKLEGEEIYSKLKEINMWLIGKMEEYDMFGKKKKKLEGL